MNVKKVLACGLMLGMLAGISIAQRQRLGTGGTLPGARLPNATHQPIIHSGSDTTRITPNAVNTARPDAIVGRTPQKSKANVTRVPDRVITPDTIDRTDRISTGPIQ